MAQSSQPSNNIQPNTTRENEIYNKLEKNKWKLYPSFLTVPKLYPNCTRSSLFIYQYPACVLQKEGSPVPISHRVQQYRCRALCKISKQFGNRNGYSGLVGFRGIRVKDGFWAEHKRETFIALYQEDNGFVTRGMLQAAFFLLRYWIHRGGWVIDLSMCAETIEDWRNRWWNHNCQFWFVCLVRSMESITGLTQAKLTRSAYKSESVIRHCNDSLLMQWKCAVDFIHICRFIKNY